MIFDEVEIGSNRIQPERLARPIVSTLDTWDQATQIDYPHAPTRAQRRAGWNIPSVAVTNESINTIRSSSNTRFVSPRIAQRAGIHSDAITYTTSYKPMPNMAQTIRTDSDVQISFSAVVSTWPTAYAPSFAVFRDGRQISQDYHPSGAAVDIRFVISGAYVDTNAPAGLHTYDLRWKVEAAGESITARGKDRTFQASNLRAQ